MSRETKVFNNEDSEEHLIEVEEAQRDTNCVEAHRKFRTFIIELAGGIADTGLIETEFKDMLFVYKTHFVNGLSVGEIMSHIYNGYGNDSLLPLEREDIDKLFTLYFKSIGFMPEIWVKGYDVSFPIIEL